MFGSEIAAPRHFEEGSGRMKKSMIITIGLAAAFLAGSNGRAMAQDFAPIRKLTTWYTDRSLVDIEIVGSTSLLADSHRLEPERVLRFRLERAYVHTLIAQEQPGFEIVGFGFDTETGLADSLIVAASMRGRFQETIPGIPDVSQSDRFRRTLMVSLRNDISADSVRQLSDGSAKCGGAPLEHGLLAYEWEGRRGCRRPTYPRASKYLARYENDLLLPIMCREESFRGFGCSLRFPFEGFGTGVTFHRDHLPNWREVIERASAFLRSKQYR